MANYVYVIGSVDARPHRTYVGWTNDLGKRLAAHNLGKGARSTSGRQWMLLYAERYRTRSEAMSREWRLKRERPFRERLKSNLQFFLPKRPLPANR